MTVSLTNEWQEVELLSGDWRVNEFVGIACQTSIWNCSVRNWKHMTEDQKEMSNEDMENIT